MGIPRHSTLAVFWAKNEGSCEMDTPHIDSPNETGSARRNILKGRLAGAFHDSESRWWRLTNGLIFAVIVASVAATVLESVPEFENGYRGEFELIEVTAVAFFTIELLLRLWSANDPISRFGAHRHPRLAYLFSPSGLIDLLSIIPFYLGATNLLVLRSFRLLRIFRVLKLTRQARAMTLLGQALRARRHELTSLAVVVGLSLLISASIMYSAEHEAQPKHFGSIPQSLWWAVATLTTVGYGDLYPTTAIGRICASFIMLLGIALVALPTGMLGSAMYEILQHRTCPHCGAKLQGSQPPLMGEPAAKYEAGEDKRWTSP
jgi:voltage-gated potassium channel